MRQWVPTLQPLSTARWLAACVLSRKTWPGETPLLRPAAWQQGHPAWGRYCSSAVPIRSRAEVQEYQAKRELVAKEEAKRTGSERHVKLRSPTHPTTLTCRPVQEGVVPREVWAEQADLLVTQVCCAHPPPHILHTTHSCTFSLWLYVHVCMHKWNYLCPFPTRGSRDSIRLLGSYYMKQKHQHRYADNIWWYYCHSCLLWIGH